MNETPSAIAYVVEKCLKYAVASDSPALAAVDFIAVMKSNQTLSDLELSEVGRQVIKKLGERAHEARFPSDGSNT
jgi:hypothetical protein